MLYCYIVIVLYCYIVKLLYYYIIIISMNNISLSGSAGRSLQDILNSQSQGITNRNRRHKGTGARHSQALSESKNEYRVEDSDFPELNSVKSDTNNNGVKSDTNNNGVKNDTDYKRVVVDYDTVAESSDKKGKPGWVFIDKKTKRITRYDLHGNPVVVKEGLGVERSGGIVMNRSQQSREIYKIYEKMSNRWNNYYDENNRLFGDRSPYLNYQSAIDKIVEEENRLFKTCYHDYNDYLSGDDDVIIEE